MGFLAGAASAVGSAVGSAAGAVGSAAGAVGSAVGAGASALGGTLAGWGSGAWGAIQGALGGGSSSLLTGEVLGPFASTGNTAALQALASAPASSGGWLSSLGSTLGGWGGSIGNALGNAWGGISGFGSDVGGWIQNALGMGGGGGSSTTSGLWGVNTSPGYGWSGTNIGAPTAIEAAGTGGGFNWSNLLSMFSGGGGGGGASPTGDQNNSFWGKLSNEIFSWDTVGKLGEAMSGTQGTLQNAMAMDAANGRWQQIYNQSRPVTTIPQTPQEGLGLLGLELMRSAPMNANYLPLFMRA